MEQFFVQDIKYHVNLRDKQSKEPTLVYFVISHKSRQYKVSTKVKVLPIHFKNGQAVILKTMDSITKRNNMVVNKKIIDYQALFFDLIKYICSQNTIDIKSAINRVYYNRDTDMRKKVTKVGKKISALFIQATLNHKMAESSRGGYLSEIDSFCKWADTLGKSDVSDLSFDLFKGYYEYIKVMRLTHKVTGEEVYISDNVVRAKMRKLQSVIGYVETYDTQIYNDYLKDISFASIYALIEIDKVEENQIYIDDDEVDRLLELNEELTEKQRWIRDVFVFQMEIGQRFSDVEPLLGKPLDISNNKLTLIQQKTEAKVTVPFTERVKTLVEKYNGTLPIVTISQVDRGIKKICKMAGIVEPIKCSEHRNGELYAYEVPKYKLVSSHSARRSFISQGLKMMDAKVLSKITGHTTDASFNKYNRLNSDDAVELYLKKKQGATEPNKEASEPLNLPDNIKAMVYRKKLVEMTGGIQPFNLMSDEEIIALYENK